MTETKEWVKEQGVSVEEILFDTIYERARARAVERVEQAIVRGMIGETPLINEVDCSMEIFSYPVARMIAVSFENEYVLRRYALAEAKKAYEKMKNEDMQFIVHVAEEFGMEIKNNAIHFSDYLKYAPTWDMKWKLVNRDLKNGYVSLTKQEIARLLQEAIRKKIYDEMMHLYAPPEIKKIFHNDILRLRSKITVKKGKKIRGDASFPDFPPCIKAILSAVKSGTNVPHVGRFTLVTFLNAIGMDEDEILKLFSKSPDFQEDKARYQIEHITGKISGTVYSIPRCSTIRTWGLCYPDERCKYVAHPLMYYRRKRK